MTQSKLAKYTQEKTPAKVQNNFNTNKLKFKIMSLIAKLITTEFLTTTIVILMVSIIYLIKKNKK